MNRIDELRETWEKAYRGLVKDLGNKPTLEDVACMFFELGWRAADEHPDGSQIKWETGEPKENGEYLVSLEDGSVCRDEWREIYREDDIRCWVYNEGEVTAWCKLSDIEPYKDKEEQP